MTETGKPPRVLLCTSGGLYGALVMRRLLDSPNLRLGGVVRSTRVLRPQGGWLADVQSLLGRSGLPYLVYLGVATSLAEIVGRWGTVQPVGLVARRHGLPVLETKDINDGAARAFIARQAPDLLLSAFFNQRIGEPVCDLPRLGAVNIHPSLLPAFKGVDPVFHARRRGATSLGVSVHRISPDLDAGALLAQASVDVPVEASLLEATARLFERGAGLLLDALPDLVQGGPGRPQPTGGEYDSWPTASQVVAFRRAGQRLFRLRDLGLMFREGGLVSTGSPPLD